MMTNKAEAAVAKVASAVATFQQNFDGANVDTIAAIAKHWSAYQVIGTVPDEDEEGSLKAIQAEVEIKCEMLKSLAFASPADIRVVGRYLETLATVDEWWRDDEAVEALMQGMRRAIGAAPLPEHPWVRARRLAWELTDALAEADDGQMAIVMPAHGGNKPSVMFGDIDVFGKRKAG